MGGREAGRKKETDTKSLHFDNPPFSPTPNLLHLHQLSGTGDFKSSLPVQTEPASRAYLAVSF